MLLLRDRSPRVEGMINGEVDGLTRVQLRVNAVAQTEAELAAHREMQDVYEAKRMLAEARKTGNEMDVKRAEEKLALEQEEADAAIATAARERKQLEEQKLAAAAEAQAKAAAAAEAAYGPDSNQLGWRDGKERSSIAPDTGGVDRRRLMQHRPQSARPAVRTPSTQPARAASEEPKIRMIGSAALTTADTLTPRPPVRRRPQSARPAPVASQAEAKRSAAGQSRPHSAAASRPTSARTRDWRNQQLPQPRPSSARPASSRRPQSSNPRKPRSQTSPRVASAGAKQVRKIATSKETKGGRPVSARPVLESHAFQTRA